jgi:hypothetical protein
MLGKLAGMELSGFNWLSNVPVADCCECGDEPSYSGATDLVICKQTIINIIHVRFQVLTAASTKFRVDIDFTTRQCIPEDYELQILYTLLL